MRKTMIAAAMTTALTSTAAMAIPKDFKARADAILAASYASDGPGAVAVVYEKGKPVYAVGRGLADVAAKVPLTPQTPMRLGSITKQFTAAVVLQLVAEGKVGLDDPLSTYFSDTPQPAAHVTVRQLLNHTAGIRNYTAIPGFMAGESAKPHTTDQLVALFRDAPLDFPAGSRWAYSNSGYILLGAIIEKVTGKPWWDAVEQRIARPLHLSTLRYGGGTDGEAGASKGYSILAGQPVPARLLDMSVPHAAGALVASASDLAAWAYALHHGKVVDKARYALMIAPTALPDGTKAPYGFGVAPGDVRSHPAIGHNGGINGFSTDSLYLSKEDVFVAVLANSDRPAVDPEMVTRRLAALAIGDPYESFVATPLDTQAVAPFAGVYRSGDIERALFLRDGKLFTRRKGGGAVEVSAAQDGRFFYADSLSWFALAHGADGRPVMTFHQDGAAKGDMLGYAGPMPADAPLVSVSRATLERLTGAYRGPEPVTVAIDGAGVLTLQFGSQALTHLLPESATTFRVEEFEAKVSFQEEGGKVTGLTIHQNGKMLPIPRAN